ncbi:MAG: SDR family oxidoreductase [Phycisphaerae bacterium]
MDLDGRVALVSGSARRIGRAIALCLAEAGADVAIHYHRSAEQAERTAARARALGRRVALVRADLAEPTGPHRLVADVLEQLGRLDILVNNAAIFEPTELGEIGSQSWWRMLQVNLTAPAMLSAEAFAAMRRQGSGGRIVNIADVCAERAWAGYIGYCASKAALVAVTRAMARAMAPHVLVNAVSPGIVAWADQQDQDRRDELLQRVPLGRAGSVDDVAAAVLFLVRDADYMTGQVIAVDGGRSIA